MQRTCSWSQEGAAQQAAVQAGAARAQVLGVGQALLQAGASGAPEAAAALALPAARAADAALAAAHAAVAAEGLAAVLQLRLGEVRGALSGACSPRGSPITHHEAAPGGERSSVREREGSFSGTVRLQGPAPAPGEAAAAAAPAADGAAAGKKEKKKGGPAGYTLGKGTTLLRAALEAAVLVGSGQG